ncbi:site-specific integrase [Breoghania sp. L-A4]|uniref:tyrosine-type recombinase/integrase n=1 Tax=Breoghania sp. L-A4 TaxID=2304600 RepID=UPI000E360CA3|nr:site-specific integrase [Breoghania sp. L-A4]AXS39230.1 integrase [Breoghania sp. L-A4]
MRVRLKGINTVTKRRADGTKAVYRYHRATGHPLPGEPGSPEFLAAIHEAEKIGLDRHAGTVIGLIRDFTLSPEFDNRADSTKREYRRILTKVEAEFGDMPIAVLNDPRVRREFLEWRAKLARSSGLREADNRLSIISAMLSWAKENGHVDHNHVIGFKRLYKANRSEAIWLPQHIKAFCEDAPVDLQRALILALHTGQRQGDLLRLSWTNFDGRCLDIRQSKTGARVVVPCTKALKAMLDSLPRDSVVILTTKTGRPWTAYNFRHAWKAAADKAGITGLHFHDLRGTAVTMLAEAGCTLPEIAAITGHSLRTVSTILEKYLALTRPLAEQAIARLENKNETAFANQLQTMTSQGEKEAAK